MSSSSIFLAQLWQGHFVARCGCLGLARHKNSHDVMLCLAHKISDRFAVIPSSICCLITQLLRQSERRSPEVGLKANNLANLVRNFMFVLIFGALAAALGLANAQSQVRPLLLPLESQWTPGKTLVPSNLRTSNATPVPGLERLSVGVGDQIFITVFGQPDMSAEVTVNDNQQVTLPLVGTLKVGGLTPPVIEKLIAQRLKEGEYLHDPEVSIQVRQVRSQTMSVLGEVQRPGRFVITGKMTLLDAVATAGGVTQRADQSIVLIRRNTLANGDSQRQELIFSINQLIDTVNMPLDIELKNDDVVFIPQQKLFYIYGEVKKPGAYPMELELNVMRALAIGGGLTDRGSFKRIKIHRKDKIEKLETIMPQLIDPIHGGDVIFVDERIF